MYLKTKNTNTAFEVSGMSFDGKKLSMGYINGTVGQSIMVHAFKADSLTEDTVSYVAALPIKVESSEFFLDVSSAWGISSAADLEGYTIKVWMEDSSNGLSLAAATTPETFYGTGERISASEKEVKNLRVFATKDQLQCSWGTLKNADDLVGENPTNQKIYFGAKDGTPLQFWIAGRENENGEIDSNGEIMTLYQAKSVDENKIFNAKTLIFGSDPDGGGIAPNSSGLQNDILIQVKYGQTLGDLGFDFDKEIGKLKDIDGNILEGFWSWKDGDDTKVGEVGEHTFIAVFKPADNNYTSVEVNVTVNVSVDKSGWGEEEKDSPEILLDKPTETQSPSDHSVKIFSTGDSVTNVTIYALGLTMIVLLGILMITSYRRRSEK